MVTIIYLFCSYIYFFVYYCLGIYCFVFWFCMYFFALNVSPVNVMFKKKNKKNKRRHIYSPSYNATHLETTYISGVI